MGRTKLTTREFKLKKRVIKRNKSLKKAAVLGYKRPADFPKIDHVTGKEVSSEL